METALACKKHRNNAAVEYFLENFEKQRSVVESYYFENNRVRLLDRFDLFKFKSLIK